MEKNISFEHSLRHSFMHIKNMEIPQNAYETKLLKETHVPGTLKLNINSDLNGTILSYDISGLESMEKYLENHSLSYLDISMLVESLNTLLGSLEEYMISENSVSLTPSSIFFNPEKKEWNFTVIPGYKNEFHQDLSGFLSYLLKHINYNDDRAVIMGYSLFQESNKEFYQITDLLRIVRANMAKEVQAAEISNVLDFENNAAQNYAFPFHNSMNPFTSSCYSGNNTSVSQKSYSPNTIIKKQISADGIFRPKDAGIVLNSQKDTVAHLNSCKVNQNPSYQANSCFPNPNISANNMEIHSHPELNNTSYVRPLSGQRDDISFSSDYGNDDYFKDELVPGVEGHDISKETNLKKPGLFSFSPKNKFDSKITQLNRETDTISAVSGSNLTHGFKNEKSQREELQNDSISIKEHLEEKTKNSSLKAKIFISVLLMLLIPSLVWFLKGGLIFKKALPLIIALEIGLSMMIALDFIMNKLPDESVK